MLSKCKETRAMKIDNCNLSRALALVLLAGASLANVAWAEPPAEEESSLDSFLDMPLADLLTMEVSSVSKRLQPLGETAAAIFVITAEDIRRSGAATFADLLRMVPGMNVAQINSQKFAVSARGFNDLFANKLLVLIDGRSIYSPMFAGVEWEVRDTVLDDIERIEIIRGPGATLWGANAVNGVINIITRSTADVRGGEGRIVVGNELQRLGSLRYEGAIGDRATYRVYAKYTSRDDSKMTSGGDNRDAWTTFRTGFRIDLHHNARNDLRFQGEFFEGTLDSSSPVKSLSPPFTTDVDDTDETTGRTLGIQWNRLISDGSELSLQLSYEHFERGPIFFKESRDTVDLDFQHTLPYGNRHQIVWGLNYRNVSDDIDGSFTVTVDPAQRNDHTIGGFIQDEVALVTDRLRLTIGSKVEHNNYTRVEFQPGVRLAWTPNPSSTWWGAVSRAVRVPSRFNHDGKINTTFAGFPVPNLVALSGNDSSVSEELIAYEFGYRNRVNDRIQIDAALFFNVYDELISSRSGVPACQPSGTPPPCFIPGDTHFEIPVFFDNNQDGETYGVELAADWQVRDWWQLKAAYTYLRMNLNTEGAAVINVPEEGLSPKHQLSARSTFLFSNHVELDFWLRYVDELPTLDIASYVTLDANIVWKLQPKFELSLVGRNLLDRRHPEFVTTQSFVPPSEIERSVYAQLRWAF